MRLLYPAAETPFWGVADWVNLPQKKAPLLPVGTRTNQDKNKPMEERINACAGKLKTILEAHGDEEFIEAVQRLLDSHPTTQPVANRSYQILILPDNYDVDVILQTTLSHCNAGVTP